MHNHVKFNALLQKGLWAEVTNTAMLLENNLLTQSRNLSPFQQCFGNGKRCILSLMQKFGEMCITNHWAKLVNHGTPGILVGNADGHPTST